LVDRVLTVLKPLLSLIPRDDVVQARARPVLLLLTHEVAEEGFFMDDGVEVED